MKRRKRTGFKTFLKILGSTILVGVLVWTGLYFAFPKVKNWTNEKVFKIEQKVEEPEQNNSEEIKKLESEIEVKNEAIKTLTADLNTSRENIAKLQAMAEVDAKEIVKLQKQVEEKEDALELVVAEKEALKTKKSELEADVTAKQNQIAELETNAAANAETIAELQADVTAKQNEIAELETNAEENAETIAELQADVTAIQNQIAELEAQAETDAQTIEDLQTNLTNTQSELTNVNSQLEAKTTEATTLASQLAEVTAERDSLSTSLAEKNVLITELEADVTYKEREIAEKNSEINALNVEIADLEKIIYDEDKIYYSQLLKGGQAWVSVETPQGTFVSPTSYGFGPNQYSGLWKLYSDRSVEKVYWISELYGGSTQIGYNEVFILDDHRLILKGINSPVLLCEDGVFSKFLDKNISFFVADADTVIYLLNNKIYKKIISTKETIECYSVEGMSSPQLTIINKTYVCLSDRSNPCKLINIQDGISEDLAIGNNIYSCIQVDDENVFFHTNIGVYLYNLTTKTHEDVLVTSNDTLYSSKDVIFELDNGDYVWWLRGNRITGFYYLSSSNLLLTTIVETSSVNDVTIYEIDGAVFINQKESRSYLVELGEEIKATQLDYGKYIDVVNDELVLLYNSSYSENYYYTPNDGLVSFGTDEARESFVFDEYIFLVSEGSLSIFSYHETTLQKLKAYSNSGFMITNVFEEEGSIYLYSNITDKTYEFNSSDYSLTEVTEQVA